MQSVHDFMGEFLRARVIEEEALQSARLPFRKKFFSPDCQWDSRSRSLEKLRSEKVSSVEFSPTGPVATTSYRNPFSKRNSGTVLFMRYHLMAKDDGWIIRVAEMGCVACEGVGDATCPACKGRHWL